jgi:hypothetical protein
MLVIPTSTALLVVISCAVTVFRGVLTNDENQAILRLSIDIPALTEGSSHSGTNTVRTTSGMAVSSRYETNC